MRFLCISDWNYNKTNESKCKRLYKCWLSNSSLSIVLNKGNLFSFNLDCKAIQVSQKTTIMKEVMLQKYELMELIILK